MIIKKILSFFFIVPICLVFGTEADHLIFTRIATNPDNSEAVFIHNPTNETINLNNPNGGSYFLTDGYVPDDSDKHYTNIPFVNNGYKIYDEDNNLFNSGDCILLGEFTYTNTPDDFYDVFITDFNDNIVNITYLNDVFSDCNLVPDNSLYLSNDEIWIKTNLDFKDINFKISNAIILNSVFSDNSNTIDKEFWSQTYWNDFFVQFPENATINPGETQIISMHSDSIFYDYYYYYPDYNIHDLTTIGTENFTGDNQVFDYLEDSGNNGESLMMFYWDGTSNIVQDVDYFLWGSRAFAIDKTNNNLYLPDQDSDFQSYLENTINHYSYNRVFDEEECCFEFGETSNGGNGITGHNETSENFEQSWNVEFNPEKKIGCLDDSWCSGINDYCALNYNLYADVDYSELYDTIDYTNNNRCIYNYGCMDATKFNYDVEATKDYSSCVDDSVYPLRNIEDVLNFTYPTGEEVLISGKLVSFRLIEDTFWILTIRDNDNFQIDVTGSGWNIELSKLNYLVEPHNYTQHIVSVLGIVDEYNGTAQVSIESERRIDDYIRYHNDGEFIEDYNSEISSAEIVTAPYVIIPTQGERIDFKYSFPSNSRVIIRVFSLDGRVVTTLLDRFYDASGTVLRMDELSDWDGRDHLGEIVPPGTYLFHIEASNFNTGATSVDVCPVVVGVNH